jgi:hypothetical protein
MPVTPAAPRTAAEQPTVRRPPRPQHPAGTSLRHCGTRAQIRGRATAAVLNEPDDERQAEEA